jgi:hypothetical protein
MLRSAFLARNLAGSHNLAGLMAIAAKLMQLRPKS